MSTAPLATWRLDNGLLNRGSQVRALPGAPFPKEFANFLQQEILRRSFIEESDRSCEFAPQLRECAIGAFPSAMLRGTFSCHRRNRSTTSLIIGLVFRRSLYVVAEPMSVATRHMKTPFDVVLTSPSLSGTAVPRSRRDCAARSATRDRCLAIPGRRVRCPHR